MKSKVHPRYKTKYRVVNWAAYNRALVRRGDVTVWLSSEAVAVHPASGREYEEAQSVGHSLRLLGKQPLAPTLFRRFANLGRFVALYGAVHRRSR